MHIRYFRTEFVTKGRRRAMRHRRRGRAVAVRAEVAWPDRRHRAAYAGRPDAVPRCSRPDASDGARTAAAGHHPPHNGAVCPAVCAAPLGLTLALYRLGGWAPLFNAVYRSGAPVFGSGHMVLPLLLQAMVAPGWVDASAFLAGYGTMQVLPCPLFTFSACLGAVTRPPREASPTPSLP